MYKRVVKELIIGDPRPFPSCHASHLALLSNGEVLAVWFGGSSEGADDVAIWSSRRKNGVWTAPIAIADEDRLPHWNPVLFALEDGKIMLFYKVGRKIKHWYTKLIVSDDNGMTWSHPVELVEGDRGGRGPVRNKMLVLKDGTWLAPASKEDGIWTAFVDRSADQGKTWIRGSDIEIGRAAPPKQAVEINIPVTEQSFLGRGVIQPTLWESRPGIVHMMLRSSEGEIYRSDSNDSGRSWSEPYPTGLPNNNSGIDVARMDDGTLVLIHNPVGENWGPRTPLVLRSSKDDGITWSDEYILENGPGEYSYPAIVAKGNNLYLTYTWRRENIAYWQLAVSL